MPYLYLVQYIRNAAVIRLMTTSTFILILTYSLFHQELQVAQKLIQNLETPYICGEVYKERCRHTFNDDFYVSSPPRLFLIPPGTGLHKTNPPSLFLIPQELVAQK
jgi:hypothetical protein